MATQDNPTNKIAELPLTAFELPRWLVAPAVRSCRLFNTALHFVFYDVPTLRAALAEKDAPMQARGEKPPSRITAFDALSGPEGSLLLIDATTAPYVHKYQSVEKFLQSPYQETRDVDIDTASRPSTCTRPSSPTTLSPGRPLPAVSVRGTTSVDKRNSREADAWRIENSETRGIVKIAKPTVEISDK